MKECMQAMKAGYQLLDIGLERDYGTIGFVEEGLVVQIDQTMRVFKSYSEFNAFNDGLEIAKKMYKPQDSAKAEHEYQNNSS